MTNTPVHNHGPDEPGIQCNEHTVGGVLRGTCLDVGAYSPETQALLAAVMSGDCCPECSAPNNDRHLDDCSRHPENIAETANEWRRLVGPEAPLWMRRLIDDTERWVRDNCAMPETAADALENEALREEIAVLTAERDAALLRADRAEGELHDLQERNADIAAGIENRRGKAAQSS